MRMSDIAEAAAVADSLREHGSMSKAALFAQAEIMIRDLRAMVLHNPGCLS